MNLQGSLWFNGNGTPSTTAAANASDHYLDSSTGNVWRFSGTPQSGVDWSLWYSGHNVPTLITGIKANDHYLDLDTGNVWAFS